MGGINTCLGQCVNNATGHVIVAELAEIRGVRAVHPGEYADIYALATRIHASTRQVLVAHVVTDGDDTRIIHDQVPPSIRTRSSRWLR